jgi:TPR repeat protein
MRLAPLILALAATGPLGGCMFLSPAIRSDPPQRAPAPDPRGETCRYGDYHGCMKLCAEGSGSSCNNLGAMYETGQHAPRNAGHALRHYQQACDRGAPAGCENAARISR